MKKRIRITLEATVEVDKVNTIEGWGLCVEDIASRGSLEDVKLISTKDVNEKMVFVLVHRGRGYCVYEISEEKAKNCPITNPEEVAKFFEENGSPTERGLGHWETVLEIGPGLGEWEEQKAEIEEMLANLGE